MVTAERLEKLYNRYNDRIHVSPDPLQFLYDYPWIRDREIAGLIASSLAYGRVAQIIKSVSLVLERIGPQPRDFLLKTDEPELGQMFSDFRHRFTEGSQLGFLLCCIRNAVKRYGSLNECFLAGYREDDENILASVKDFISRLTCKPQGFCNSLFPDAAGKSALKRFNLYLRWMVRKDRVDPGGWEGIEASKLIIPLDTHMHRISLKLQLTARKQADMKTALEVTRAFGKFCPKDPVKYDFALTRLGIKNCGYIF
ncbi:MAG: TIGR02757 family protein [Actinomycetota bacterium]